MPAVAKKSNMLNFEHPEYEAQADGWEKREDLYLGASRVKSKATKYLPATSTEEEENRAHRQPGARTPYSRRLERAVYFNGLSRLVRYAMGHVFRIDPTYQGNLPQSFDKMKRDADLMGTPFSVFAENVGKMTYLQGLHLVMVDFPDTRRIDSRSVQKIVNPRPYLVPVSSSEIINWDISRSLDGTFEFNWLVHRYAHFVSNGPQEDHVLTVYYKIWWKNKWELWSVEVPEGTPDDGLDIKVLDSQVPVLVDSGPNPAGMVPYVPFYSEFVRPMVGRSSLEEASELNVSHYQSFSDFTHGLRYHLNPILVTTGTMETEVNRSATSGLNLPRGGDAKYVETAGGSLKIALETADRIAAEMWEAGMRSSSAVGANTSAEARKLSRTDFFSFLTGLVSSWENSWARVMKLVSLWEGNSSYSNEKPIKLNDDFDVGQLEANQAEFLLNARKAGEISKGLFLSELKRGGVLKGDLDVEAEKAAAKKDLQDDLAALAAAEAAANPNSGETPDTEGEGEDQPPKDDRE